MSGGWNSVLIRLQEPRSETRKGAPAVGIPHPLCLRLMDLLMVHIKAQPFQESTEEAGNRFTCHSSTKAHASQVTKRTEMANEKGLNESLARLF